MKSRGLAIIGMSLLFFLVFTSVALVLCDFRVKYVSQDILSRQRESQQAWLDKTMERIRSWREELLRQARHISAAEFFRLYVIDVAAVDKNNLSKLANPETLKSGDSFMKSMTEQTIYIQDLLKDFTSRRAWNDARLLLVDGSPLVEPKQSAKLTAEQVQIARKAGESGKTVFGPIRENQEGLLVMDMADPLFKVLAGGDDTPVAVLMLSVPMDKPLTAFLSRRGAAHEALLPRIVNSWNGSWEMVLPHNGGITVKPVVNELDGQFSFGERKALDGQDKVYSMSSRLEDPDWLYVIETPFSKVQAIIRDRESQIYGMGILWSAALSLCVAFIWAMITGRASEARARRLQKLYDTIRDQKTQLDSINASLSTGLLLLDKFNRVANCNPVFKKICNREEINAGEPLAHVFPSEICAELLGGMNLVAETHKPKSMEMTIRDTKGNDRLYRVDIYPYADSGEGVVAVFADITEFRRKALAARERENALVSAMGRAIESIDPHLVGHSDKMEKVAMLVADELGVSGVDRETLRLASRLSQVGKIFVPRELLVKKEALTSEELAELKRAPEYTIRLIENLHFDLPVGETVRLIGERMDGSGNYGLKGDEIPLIGRILAIVNALVALTSERAWRKSRMNVKDALAEMGKDLGMDQDIVAVLNDKKLKDILE